jgi:hypothetical protein
MNADQLETIFQTAWRDAGRSGDDAHAIDEQRSGLGRIRDLALIALRAGSVSETAAPPEPLHNSYDGLTDEQCLRQIARFLEVASQRGDSLGWAAIRELVADVNAVADRVRSSISGATTPSPVAWQVRDTDDVLVYTTDTEPTLSARHIRESYRIVPLYASPPSIPSSLASSPETPTPTMEIIDRRLDLIEERLAPHREWGECPMTGNEDCCDLLVIEARTLNEIRASLCASEEEWWRNGFANACQALGLSAGKAAVKARHAWRAHDRPALRASQTPTAATDTEKLPAIHGTLACLACDECGDVMSYIREFVDSRHLRKSDGTDCHGTMRVARVTVCASPTAGDTERPTLRPLVIANDGMVRFKPNAACRWLIDEGGRRGLGFMNSLATVEMSAEDRMEFAQLIGYSVGGYSELSYVTDESSEAAEREAEKLRKTVRADAARGDSHA